MPEQKWPNARQRAAAIRKFLLISLDEGDFREIAESAASELKVSRLVVLKQLKRLEKQGLIEGRGKTNARAYRLVSKETLKRVDVVGLEEHDLWNEFARPALKDLPENVVNICRYGFTEMVNNVVDHSESTTVLVSIDLNLKSVRLMISDMGIGIFRKVQRAFDLPSLQEAVFEITKGKVTTDRGRHTGEGIFYTSRMFDEFRLLSYGVFLSHDRAGDDWLTGSDDDTQQGTIVMMKIAPQSEHTMEEVFQYYSAEQDDYAFNKTNVALKLLDTGDDSFVSRSQAKRVLARLPRFKEVILDFEGLKTIGPAFADEIFRVFRREHPEVHLTPVNVPQEVSRMIDRATRAEEADGTDAQQPGLFKTDKET